MNSKLDFLQTFIQEEPWPINQRPLVIAELGINHNGDLDLAKRLIQTAKACGCNAVKFQKRTPELCVAPNQQTQVRETPWGSMTYLEYRRRVELSKEDFRQIDELCRTLEIPWFASAWDIPSLQFLEPFDPPFHKVASAMVVHTELLKRIAAQRKPTFVSTGMSTYSEIDAAVEIFERAGCPIVLLHTVSEYPAGDEVLNLRQMLELRSRYGVPVGYSGHEADLFPTLMAVVMGAAVVERHITLDKTMWGTDQSASLDPVELEKLVREIERIPVVLGDGTKRVTAKEQKNAEKLRYFEGITNKSDQEKGVKTEKRSTECSKTLRRELVGEGL